MTYTNSYRHAGNTPLREWATHDELEAYRRGCQDCYGMSADHRFQAACAALQGLLTSGGYGWGNAPEQAVRCADELLTALEKEPGT